MSQVTMPKQKFPFNFNVSIDEFITEVAKPHNPKLFYTGLYTSAVLTYLYFQYLLLSESPKKYQRYEELFKSVSLNAQPKITGKKKLIFDFSASEAAQAAHELLGKDLVDPLTPSPVLTWLASTKGGDKNVQAYLNQVALKIMGKIDGIIPAADATELLLNFDFNIGINEPAVGNDDLPNITDPKNSTLLEALTKSLFGSAPFDFNFQSTQGYLAFRKLYATQVKHIEEEQEVLSSERKEKLSKNLTKLSESLNTLVQKPASK